jgi:outer membrane protein assembly factor BamD (BamD/ComL family)
MANTIREYKISDLFTEEECYRKLIAEYPKSIFREEAKVRLALLKNPEAFSN